MRYNSNPYRRQINQAKLKNHQKQVIDKTILQTSILC